MATEYELAAEASEVRALCATITKIARLDLEEYLERHEAGIRAVEHGVLRHLEEKGRTLAHLSRAMMMAPSSLVPVVDGLEGKGLLERGKDPKDRRRSPLTLTGEGERLLARTPAMDGDSAMVRALGAMSERERGQLLRSLRSFAGCLMEEEDPTVGSALPNGDPEAEGARS